MSKVKSATIWLVFGSLSTIFLKLIGNLVLTRILAPEAFGIMALANVLVLGIGLMSEVGLRYNVVKEKEELTDRYLNTIWSLQVAKGFILSLLIVLLSVLIYFFGEDLGGVYASDQIVGIILFLALGPFAIGFESLSVAVLSRNLNIGVLVRVEFYSQILGVYVSIYSALSGYGVWALAFGPVSVLIVKTVLSYIVIDRKLYRFALDKEVVSSAFGFGKWIFLFSFLTFLSGYMDQILLAKYIDPHVMGNVAISLFIYGMMRQIITKYSSDIAFSRLSVAIRRNECIKEVFYRVRLPLDLYSLFFSGFVVVFGGTIVSVLYDARYSLAGEIIGILAFAMAMERFTVVSQLYSAYSEPRISTFLAFIRALLLFCGLLFCLNFYDFMVSIYFVAFYRFLFIPVYFYFMHKKNVFSFGREIFLLVVFPIGLVCGYMMQVLYDNVIIEWF